MPSMRPAKIFLNSCGLLWDHPVISGKGASQPIRAIISLPECSSFQREDDRAEPKMTIYTLRLWAGFGAIVTLSMCGLAIIWHRHDLEENFVQVPAAVTSVVTRCAVAHRGFLGRWQTEDIDCQVAEQTAQDRDTQVLFRSEIRFRFEAPLSHNPYEGVQILNVPWYQLPRKGSLVALFARRDKPGSFEYGGPYPNKSVPSGF